MPELIQLKIDGEHTQIEHHEIAAKLKAMSDKWDEIEKNTGTRPPEAYSYSFGLVMGHELTFASLPGDEDTLKQKIFTFKAEKP